MYTYVHICVYIYLIVCICVHVHIPDIYIYINLSICMYTYTCICIHSRAGILRTRSAARRKKGDRRYNFQTLAHLNIWFLQWYFKKSYLRGRWQKNVSRFSRISPTVILVCSVLTGVTFFKGIPFRTTWTNCDPANLYENNIYMICIEYTCTKYAHIYVYIYTYAYILAYTIHVYICVYIHIYILVYMYIYTYMYTYIYVNIHANVNIYINRLDIYIFTYIYIYIRKH